MARLTWTDVENLPANHPQVKEFDKQVSEEFAADAADFNILDETSIDYFNRFIAGDR